LRWKPVQTGIVAENLQPPIRKTPRVSLLFLFRVGKESGKLVTASGNRELAGDRGEDGLNFITEPDQDRNRDNGNKSQDQGVLDESLALPTFPLAAHFLLLKHGFILSVSSRLSARRYMKIV